jgi:hypothetical protein
MHVTFDPITVVYPLALPQDRWPQDREPIAVYSLTGEVLSPPSLVECIDIQTAEVLHVTMPPLYVVAQEMRRIWGFGTTRLVAHMVPYSIRGSKNIQQRRYRNPTVRDIAYACHTTLGFVRGVRHVYSRTTSARWRAYLEGRVPYDELRRTKGDVLHGRYPKAIYTDTGKRADGRPFVGEYVAPCSACGRRPRVYPHDHQWRVKCDRTKKAERCPFSDEPITSPNRDDVVEKWNRRQGDRI